MLRAILFDLDNTLYSESCGIFDLIDQRMNDWLIANLQVSPQDVNDFRNHYFVKYGTTLRGLMLHHNVNPRDFLDYVHDVPVHEFLRADEELRLTLDQVRARKMIFTNSDIKHANRILDALAVRDQFERIFDIEAMGFIPKPNPEPYRAAIDYLGLQPKEVLLIDDMERNLKPAREMGMNTVLIGDGKPVDDGHHAMENIKQLSGVLGELSRQGI
jgi:putative hydrolase of the HAD superfamily